MADRINVGLDFGTHQTKVCVEIRPDEGHGIPRYEFFKFKDLNGRGQYCLPSVVQINVDGTLSYGFVEPDRERTRFQEPQLKSKPGPEPFDMDSTLAELADKYGCSDIMVLENVLSKRKAILAARHADSCRRIEQENREAIAKFKQNRELFRYFKQAVLSEREWTQDYDCRTISVWYLAYVLFCLEEQYGQSFSINMGVPADSDSFKRKRTDATVLLLSAYHLVEDVYENDFNAFLTEKVDDLLKKTKIMPMSESSKNDYVISIFPEAYASMITLTARKKLSRGMCLIADIGGGTTDVSFFTIDEDKPLIYRYWSIPKGLNYIAERSGYEYKEQSFKSLLIDKAVADYNKFRLEIVNRLVSDLYAHWRKETTIDKGNLTKALNNRIVVYNGGGSTYFQLTQSLPPFDDVKTIDDSMWREVNIANKNEVKDMCRILTTSYGLSMAVNETDVKLKSFTTLFEDISKGCTVREYRQFIDKDMC